MHVKSRVEAFTLKLVGKALVGEKGHRASDAIGTLHFSHWVPFENNYIGFFTIFDGDMEKYLPGLRRQDLVRVRYSLSTCHWRAADSGGKERAGVLSVGTGKQLSAHRVLQRLSRPLGSRHQGAAGRPEVTIGHRPVAATFDHQPSSTRRDARWPRTLEHQQPRRRRPRGFFAECFVEGDARTRRLTASRGRGTSPRSTSRTSKGSFSAVTGCRWCGISC